MMCLLVFYTIYIYFIFFIADLRDDFDFDLGAAIFLLLAAVGARLVGGSFLFAGAFFVFDNLFFFFFAVLLRFASSWAFFCFCDKVLNAVFHSETDKDLPLQLVHGFLPHIEQPSHAAYSGEALLYFRTLPRFDQQNIKLPSASGFALISTLA
jgi:hypothetical protein